MVGAGSPFYNHYKINIPKPHFVPAVSNSDVPIILPNHPFEKLGLKQRYGNHTGKGEKLPHNPILKSGHLRAKFS